jgi:hypothetical protein
MSYDAEAVSDLQQKLATVMLDNERHLKAINNLHRENESLRLDIRPRGGRNRGGVDHNTDDSAHVSVHDNTKQSPFEALKNLPDQAVGFNDYPTITRATGPTVTESRGPSYCASATQGQDPVSDGRFYARLDHTEVQGNFETIKRKYQAVKLRSDLLVQDSRQGVKRRDQQHFNTLQKSARYTETALKVLWHIEPSSPEVPVYLEELFGVLLAHVRYLQDELSAVLVSGHFDPETASLFRTFRRNTSAFGDCIDDVRNAVQIRKYMQPEHKPAYRGNYHNYYNSYARPQQRGYYRGRGNRGYGPPHRGQYNNWLSSNFPHTPGPRNDERSFDD